MSGYGLSITRRRAIGRAALAATTLFPQTGHTKNLPVVYAKDLSRTGAVTSLVSIVQLERGLKELQSPDRLCVSQSSIPTNEADFKSIFDAYSTPLSYRQKYMDGNAFVVYYSKGFDGPNRPSIESVDDPSSQKQAQQYGYRNEAWTAWEGYLAECEYVMTNPEDGGANDAQQLARECLTAVQNYLSLAPREDVETALLRL